MRTPPPIRVKMSKPRLLKAIFPDTLRGLFIRLGLSRAQIQNFFTRPPQAWILLRMKRLYQNVDILGMLVEVRNPMFNPNKAVDTSAEV